MIRKTLLAVLFTTLLASSAIAQKQPKNVILFVGDGCGPAHFTAVRAQRAAEARIATMPVIGLSATSCSDRAVTDSAAAATALATGHKTIYERVSMDAEGKPLRTVLEVAEKAGKVTGVVTTADFWDATPAAFTAHAPHRREGASIIKQMLASGAELIIGTGLQAFGTNEIPTLADALAGTGFKAATTRAELDAITGNHILGVFPSQPRNLDVPDAPLPMLTQYALDKLRGHAAGFFLVIEHEGTDSSSHQNNSADTTKSLASLDTAVGVALDFAAKSGDTLVLVTGDHETGGMRLSETKSGRLRLEWSTAEHTATAIPVFAFGPGSAGFAGMYENTEVGRRLLAIYGTAP